MAVQAATPQAPAPLLLPQFQWENDVYRDLFCTLWPTGGAQGVLALGEPPALLDRIETLTPDDGWLTPNSKKSDSNAMDMDDPDGDGEGEGDEGEDVDEGPAGIRYINLEAHPTLALDHLRSEVYQRGDKDTFVIRHEYGLFMEHAMSLLSNPPDDSFRARFFVTGQPGIGKSFGCYYFLFRLLALGESVFFVNGDNSVYYFSSDGVQECTETLREKRATREALRNSWVLIDVDDKLDWTPPQIFNFARCVVCTSPPRESCMNKFVKRFGAEKWYMKTWSSKEIAVVTKRLAIDRAKIVKRLDTGGPVARSLFGGAPVPSPETIDDAVKRALGGNIFAFTPSDAVHRVFLIEPLVVIDKTSGRACLQRTDYSVEFLSAHMAHRTSDLAQDYLERVQGQLAAALNTSTTHSVAGKLVEGMIHRALTHGMQLPAVFSAGTVAGTLELMGKAGSFVCGNATTDIAKERSLYLRPGSLNFAAVNAILVTHDKLGFIQASQSLGNSHRRNFGMMLRIMSRLPRGVQVDVRGLGEVIYCFVGTVPERVQKLVAEASATLAELKMFDAQKLGQELRMRHAKIVHTRLSTFRVVGYTFDHKRGFTAV